MKPHCQYLFFLTCCLYLDLVLILELNRGSCLGFNIKLCSCHLILSLISLFPTNYCLNSLILVCNLSNLFLSSFFGLFLLYIRNMFHNNFYTQTFPISKFYQNFFLITDGPFVTCSCFGHGLFVIQKFYFM